MPGTSPDGLEHRRDHPGGRRGPIGLETALYSAQSPYTAFTKWSSDPGAGDKERIELTSEARVYIVNNWSKPITITAVSAPEEDLFYRMPTSAAEINKATMGNDGRSLHDWLKEGPGLYASQCLPCFTVEELTEDDYQDTGSSFYYATDLLTVLEGPGASTSTGGGGLHGDPGREIAVGSRIEAHDDTCISLGRKHEPVKPGGWPIAPEECSSSLLHSSVSRSTSLTRRSGDCPQTLSTTAREPMAPSPFCVSVRLVGASCPCALPVAPRRCVLPVRHCPCSRQGACRASCRATCQGVSSGRLARASCQGDLSGRSRGRSPKA